MTTPCPSCEGVCVFLCHECGGTGGEGWKCQFCNGTGMERCVACDGAGVIEVEAE